MMTGRLTLTQLPETMAISRLESDSAIPSWALSGEFISITRTTDELSIVCNQEHVPQGIKCEKGWRCLKLEGPLDLSLIGILAALLNPLAEAGVSIFALSTFDTDYILVKEEKLEEAAQVLSRAGHHLVS
jgi:hypothetical protein